MTFSGRFPFQCRLAALSEVSISKTQGSVLKLCKYRLCFMNNFISDLEIWHLFTLEENLCVCYYMAIISDQSLLLLFLKGLFNGECNIICMDPILCCITSQWSLLSHSDKRAKEIWSSWEELRVHTSSCVVSFVLKPKHSTIMQTHWPLQANDPLNLSDHLPFFLSLFLS